ncbi:hypothetical protein OKW12_002754 [Pseudomonas silensiensis]|uniref:Uncharacterized protein n=2 Tax=Pseudomonas fluorescens group TaxID=136843 RepID=A0A5E7KWT3_PSEFL|nr:hypothetical protein [Pseudomonas fluorescens]MDF9881586.1 hypothetical protein [Pseudomonas silensiensis]VVP03828.1 hypothetical protein PS870_02950 [Pseudomonas fluorescens]
MSSRARFIGFFALLRLLANLRLAADMDALDDDDIASANACPGPKLAFRTPRACRPHY